MKPSDFNFTTCFILMKPSHKITSCFILLATIAIAFGFQAQMTEITAQKLEALCSMAILLCMPAISMIYNHDATSIKDIDEKTQKRGIHLIKTYLWVSGYWAAFSAISIATYKTFSTKVDLNVLVSSVFFGIAALNVYYLLLLLHSIIEKLTHNPSISDGYANK